LNADGKVVFFVMKIRACRKIVFRGRPKQPKFKLKRFFKHKLKNAVSLKATGVSWHDYNVVIVKPSK